jgi:phospholipid/cholesterol/gamma-HCH transport system permease protein
MGSVAVTVDEGRPRIAIEGDLDAATAASLVAAARGLGRRRGRVRTRVRGRAAAAQPGGTAVLDLGGARGAGSVGVAAICEARSIARARDVDLRIENVPADLAALIDVFRARRAIDEAEPARFDPEGPRSEGIVEAIGGFALRLVADTKALVALGAESAYFVAVAPFGRRRRSNLAAVALHVGRFGLTAVPIAALIGALLGVALAVNSAYQLAYLGAIVYVADLVGLALVRELGPTMTAVLVAGRSGAEMTAEIGSMSVAEEVDALRTIGLNPVAYLVVPRLLAMLVALPLLTMLVDVLGIAAGYVAGVGLYDIASSTYVDRTLNAIKLRDLVSGLGKSFVFAVIVALVGCHRGLSVRGGAADVGRAATGSVVESITLVILANTVYTVLLYRGR